MEVFWAKGGDGASMTDLTTAMGINSPLAIATCAMAAWGALTGSASADGQHDVQNEAVEVNAATRAR
jgi:hypothetical protein